jgi:hypothetical protein
MELELVKPGLEGMSLSMPLGLVSDTCLSAHHLSNVKKPHPLVRDGVLGRVVLNLDQYSCHFSSIKHIALNDTDNFNFSRC